MVKCAFFSRIVGDKEKFMIIFALYPLIAEPFGIGSQITLFGIRNRIIEILFQIVI